MRGLFMRPIKGQGAASSPEVLTRASQPDFQAMEVKDCRYGWAAAAMPDLRRAARAALQVEAPHLGSAARSTVRPHPIPRELSRYWLCSADGLPMSAWTLVAGPFASSARPWPALRARSLTSAVIWSPCSVAL